MTKPSIPLGLVFSRSGPYAMMAGEMEKSALMAVDEVNASAEFDFCFAPHLRDPGGVVAAYHTACDDLIREARVEHIVGCYTSASRKQVIPIVERTERLLWHPARYEGFESSDNVIYVGAAPNHTVVPLARHMLDHIAGEVFCAGSNYVWTWETNRVLRDTVGSAGGRILAERLLELGETSVDHIVTEIIDRRPAAVFNTLVGESSYAFMRALHAASSRAGLSIPMLSCSLCEPELKLIGARKTAPLSRAGRRATAPTTIPPSTVNQPMSASCCSRARSAVPARAKSAPSGAPPPIIATIRRKARSGLILRTIIAS
jgi:urea transport system substrate-binding protein